ncbi:hypothetical protein COBT_000065 [Conglomerata obtusa]
MYEYVQNLLLTNKQFKILVISIIILMALSLIFYICSFFIKTAFLDTYVIGGIIIYSLFCLRQLNKANAYIYNVDDISKPSVKSSDKEIGKQNFWKDISMPSIFDTNSINLEKFSNLIYIKNHKKRLKKQKKVNKSKNSLNTIKIHLLRSKLNAGSQNADKNYKIEPKQSNNEKDMEQNTDERKKQYLKRITKEIKKKKDLENKTNDYFNVLKGIKKDAENYFDSFKDNFEKFIVSSKLIKNELLAIDISLELYSYEIKEFEYILEEKFAILNLAIPAEKKSNEQLQKDNNFLKNSKDNLDENNANRKKLFDVGLFSHIDKINTYRSMLNEKTLVKDDAIDNLKLLYNNLSKNSNKHVNDLSKALEIELNQYLIVLKRMQYYMIAQGLTAFFILLLILWHRNIFIKVFKLILILSIVANILIGLVIMIYAEVLEKKCKTKQLNVCDQNSNVIAGDLIAEINVQLDITEPNKINKIEVIKQEYKNIANNYEQKRQEFKDYIVKNSNSKLPEKIELFKDMSRKIKFIEKDFNEIMKHKVEKKVYFQNLAEMNIYLNKLQTSIEAIDLGKALEIYSEMTEQRYFFDDEFQSFDDRMNYFIADDAKKIKQKNEDICKKSVETVCQISKNFDVIYFSLLILGNIFMIMLSI